MVHAGPHAVGVAGEAGGSTECGSSRMACMPVRLAPLGACGAAGEADGFMPVLAPLALRARLVAPPSVAGGRARPFGLTGQTLGPGVCSSGG